MVEWKDHLKKYDQCISPSAEVIVDGKEWGSDRIKISRVTVSASTGLEASTCTVVLTLPYVEAGSKTLKIDSDFAKIKVGVELKVSLGYNVNKKPELKTVFIGYVSAFDMEVSCERTAVLTIYGMDAKMWMMASCKTELKKEMKNYSKVVSGIYENYTSKFKGKNITIKGEASFETPIYQRNESDYEFLCRISSITGSLFFVNLGKFYFISPPTLKVIKLTIEPERGIYSLRSSVNVWGIPKSIETVSINRKDFPKVISAKVTSSTDTIGGGKAASSLTKNIGETNLIKIIDNTLQSPEEAKFVSQAEYNKREFNLSEASLEVLGNPDILLGTGVKIKNIGNPIDNDYIVTGLEHDCNFEQESYMYITRIKMNATRFDPQQPSLF